MCLNFIPVDNPRDFNQNIEFNEAVADCIQSAICADFLDFTVPESSMKYKQQGLSIPSYTMKAIAISWADKELTFSALGFIPLSILLVTSTVITI